ncbi:sialidase family protein [Acidisarcina polymorpha]|uniref:sialidase family protein n=1 Tax=Acidisarcina polymorpha TaxID=2211140 RepID=UPI001F2B3F0A|nr:sialidase family protein [Acidisarcina polymorpha]
MTTNSLAKPFLVVLLCCLIIRSAALAQGPIQAVPGASGNSLDPNPNQRAPYPRLVRILHGEQRDGIVASVSPGVFYESRDDGRTFQEIGAIPSVEGITPKCCGTLFEAPRQVGSLSEGTLLYAGSYCGGSDGKTASIEIFASIDDGRTWTHHSTPVQRGSCVSAENDGLWEPEFEVDEEGALVMFWSDETDPCCSQKLAQMRSLDGTTWGDEQNTVASKVRTDRPGMATVSRLPSGIYFMSYELCGPAACTVFYRTSYDGWTFGVPSDTGQKIQTLSGEFFEHAPTNRWDAGFHQGEGALLLVGQYLMTSGGANAPNTGRVLFVNTSRDASGEWKAIPAPVHVDMTPYLGKANYNNCANYSSALLPVERGSALLELATAPSSLSTCGAYYDKELLGER